MFHFDNTIRTKLIYNNSCLKDEFIEDYKIVLISEKGYLDLDFCFKSYYLKSDFLNLYTLK